MAWIAIDAGTSVIKAVVFADDGSECSVARQPTAVLHEQQGWSEQNMHEVWAAVVSTVRRATAAIKEPIRGIVATAQGDGCWLVNDAGEPTGNAILWNDGRASALVEQWRQSGAIEASFRISGSVTYPGLLNAILRWLQENQPERLSGARWALTCNGWLISRMTGRFVADLSEGANPFGDLEARSYSVAALAQYGLTAYASLLPPLVAGKDTVATLTPPAAAALALPAGMPVVMAPYDIVSTAYGSGATQAGQACVILGTTICAEVLRTSINRGAEPMGTSLPLQDDLYLRAMPTLTGCEALQWAADTLGVAGIPALDALAATADQGTNRRLFFLPYLSLAGERAPFLAPEASASLHGLRLSTSRAQIALAVYEGLSFVVRECLQAACEGDLPTDVRVCGGGARSDLWCQMIADVLNVPVTRPLETEVGARGAHLFALVATGEHASITDASGHHLSQGTLFKPAANARKLYDAAYGKFLHLRDEAREQWRATGELP